MSIDRRLRQGLERSATVVDPDLRATLPDALNRGRRRKRWLNAARATTFIVSATLVAVVGSQLLHSFRNEQPATKTPSPSVSPQYAAIAGTYTATIEPHTGLPAAGMVGRWSLELSSDGVLAMTAPPGSTLPISAAYFQLHGHRFQTNAFSSDTCHGTIGTYEWGLSAGYLRFTKITDRCPVREAIFAARQWSKLTPASTASSAPPATPVVPDDGSALPPGAYATAFQPPLRLSVTRGWTGNADTSDWFRIQLGHSDAAGALEFFNIHAVIDPRTQRTMPLPPRSCGVVHVTPGCPGRVASSADDDRRGRRHDVRCAARAWMALRFPWMRRFRPLDPRGAGLRLGR